MTQLNPRYQLVCANGCGACQAIVTAFEYERTETLDGEFVSNKTAPKIASSCCGGDVDVYDGSDDGYTAFVVEVRDRAATNKKIAEIDKLRTHNQALLDALKGLQKQYAEHPDAFWDWSQARAAIKLAEGEDV